MAAATLTPSFKWAQTKTHLFVTIEVADSKDAKVELKENAIVFSGSSSKGAYALDCELVKEIDVAESRYAVRERCVEMVLLKKSADAKFWDQLPKDKLKFKNHCKVDFDRWIDEDEEMDKKKLGGGMSDLMGGGGMPGMGGMGGMPGMGNMDMAQLMAQMQAGGMGNMGGFGGGGDEDEFDPSKFGGAGGADEGDSDDDLPDLEPDASAQAK